MNNDNAATSHTGRRPALTGWLKFFRLQTEFIRVAKPAAWPIADLVIRLWLAQAFFVSGFLKLMNWQTALELAATEYPVSWMNPVTAAYTGVAIELVGSVLLAFGLMTRYAAIPMFILSLVIQFNYLPFDSQLFWAVLLSAPSHANKLLAGYVALRALGIPANFVDILLLQTFITFLLYFAPTPGSAGLAEFLSAAVMQIYVGPAELPSYALIWRFINSYATVIAGSLLFWYWLRRGLVGREEAVNIA